MTINTVNELIRELNNLVAKGVISGDAEMLFDHPDWFDFLEIKEIDLGPRTSFRTLVIALE